MRWLTDDISVYHIDSAKYDGISDSANYHSNSTNLRDYQANFEKVKIATGFHLPLYMLSPPTKHPPSSYPTQRHKTMI